MNNKIGGAIEFWENIPEELFIKIAIHDWESLERLCMALTLDIQLVNEYLNKSSKKRKVNLA